MSLPLDLEETPKWVERRGDDRDVVVSSRLRFARNIAGVAFPYKADDATREKILDRVRETLGDLLSESSFDFLRIADLSDLELDVLRERRLGSRELAEQPYGGLVFDDDESLGFLVNEEDHFRIQSLQSGFDLSSVHRRADELETALDEEFGFASDEEWGYLTACPTNLGTGMRASVLLHLPGLILRDEISRVLKAVANLGLTVRGYYGEGSESRGFYLQLSNQVTLGRSVENLLDSLSRVTERLVKKEREARHHLFNESGLGIEDKVWRSYGTLKHARKITGSETLESLSLVRLGLDAGILNDMTVPELDQLTMKVQPGHLNLSIGETLSRDDRAAYRARVLRKAFGGDVNEGDSTEPLETERSDD